MSFAFDINFAILACRLSYFLVFPFVNALCLALALPPSLRDSFSDPVHLSSLVSVADISLGRGASFVLFWGDRIKVW